MGNLSAFVFTTLNGFISDPNGDISWHQHGKEENKYAETSLKAGNILLFGRKTYEMMVSYWPTAMAKENDPTVAEGMNSSKKIVFSNSLKEATWENTEIMSGDIITKIKNLKSTVDQDITLLGSGSILTLLAENKLLDTLQLMIDPVILGNGIPIFEGLKTQLELKLTNVKNLKSGVILLTYSFQ